MSRPREEPRAHAAAIAGLASAALGISVLGGWVLGSDVLTSIVPGLVPMKPNMALGFLLLGVSLAIAALPGTARRRAVGRVLAMTAGLIGLLTLAQYAFGVDLWIDRLLPFTGEDKTGITLAGRMAPTSAANLVAFAIVLGVGSRPRPTRLTDVLLAGSGVAAIVSLVPYAYGVRTLLPALGPVTMAVHTAVTFLALMIGTYLLWRGRGALGAVTGTDRAAHFGRLLLGAAVTIPLAVGFIAVRGRAEGLFDADFEVAFVAALTMFVLGITVIAASHVMSRRDAEVAAARRSSDHSLALVRGLLHSMTDAVRVSDLDGRILLMNDAEAARLGRQPGDLVGVAAIDAYGPTVGGRIRAEEQRVIATRTSVSSTFTVEDPEEARAFHSIKTPYRDGAGRVVGVVAIARDITERAALEQELRDTTAELHRSNRDLQQFAAVASHDLQEPLRKIRAFGDRLAAEPSTDERSRDYITRMRNAAERMQTLIDDLLSYSRVTTTTEPFSDVRLDVTVEGILDDLETAAEDSGATITVDPLPVIQADGPQMRQLFQNLIGNAIKYRRPGVPPVVSVTTSDAAAGEPGSAAVAADAQVRIVIADNGIGFEQRHAERIFGQFQRLHGRGEYEGTGMGLALCRRIVERHGGTVSAVGKPGVGSTFTIELPLRQGASSPAVATMLA